MKKQILKSALIAMAGVGLLAGSAMALSISVYTDESTSTDTSSYYESSEVTTGYIPQLLPL